MTDREQKDLRSYCAYLLKEEGFHFSPTDPVIPSLYIIHKENQRSIKAIEAAMMEVEKAAKKINSTVYNFQAEGAAWEFQVGGIFKWIVVGLILALISSVGVWYWSVKNDVDKARAIIQEYGAIDALTKRVQKSDDGFYFIDFTEYQKVDAKTIRVIVGRDSTNSK